MADAKAVQAKFGIERKTTIAQDLSTITRADLIPREDVVVIVTGGGYVKRVPVAQINQQARGTRGKSWMTVGDDDVVASLLSASTHDHILAFTDAGYLHSTKVYDIPEGSSANSKGRHVRNLLDGLDGNVINVMAVPEFSDDLYLVTVSAQGSIKRTALSAYVGSARKGGVVGVGIDEGDRIVAADVVREHDHILLVCSAGRAIRFACNIDEMRPMGRSAVGTRGMRLGTGEEIVGMAVLRGEGTPLPTIAVEREVEVDGKVRTETVEEQDTRKLDFGRYLFCIGSAGAGKKSQVAEFRAQARGGKGVGAFNLNKKTGPLVKAVLVTEDQDLVMTTRKGVTNRIRVDAIRTSGRLTAGTYLMKPDTGDAVVAVSTVVRAPENEA